MTDYETAVTISMIFKQYGRPILKKSSILYRDGELEIIDKALVNSYYLKKANAIEIEIPELSPNDDVVIAQLALAIGKRLERFERGRKSNASRTAESRRKVAQNAIQARWSAKSIDQ